MTSKPRRQYTEKFKHQAVDLIRNTGKSQAQIVRELGISAVSKGAVQKLRQTNMTKFRLYQV